MVINLTADKALDQKDLVHKLPFGCWKDEDELKVTAIADAATLASAAPVANIIRNHADNEDSAKSFIQHVYPAVQRSDNNSKILTGLRYEFFVVKVLRVFLFLIVALYAVVILRTAGKFLGKDTRYGYRGSIDRLRRAFIFRAGGLILTTAVAALFFTLLLWLWSAQSRRYYKKLVHAYIVLAAPEDKSLLATSLGRGWAAKGWDNMNNDSRSSIITKPVEHSGACDGSNGISSGPAHFIASSDDNNTIRLFEADGPKSKPLLDLNPSLGFSPHSGKVRESDLEGAARIGDLIFWIGSHGRNSDAEERRERQVFFATAVSGSGENTTVKPVGQPYKELLKDLLNDGRFHDLNLAEAAKKAPKDEGALNIESICTAGQSLYIGFRNPIPGGKALIIPLLNPIDVAQNGVPAKFGEQILLDLGGLGVRDMVWWRDAFLIVAGDYLDRADAGAKPPKLFLWGGKGKQVNVLQVELNDLNPESAVLFKDGDKERLLLLSDDGELKIEGVPMKDREQSLQFFRSIWLEDVCK